MSANVAQVMRTFDDSAEAGRDGSHRETMTFLVKLNAATDPVSYAREGNDGTATVPALGSLYIVDGIRLRCSSKSANRDVENPQFVRVVCTFSREQAQADAADKWALDVSVDGLAVTEPATKDFDNKSIVNSAGQAFDPSVMYDVWDEEITVSFSSAAVDLANVSNTRGKVNNALIGYDINGQVRTFPPGTLKLARARYSTRIGDGGSPYWQISYVFHHRPAGFTVKVVDQGFYTLAAGELVEIKDRDGNPLASPALLNGSGGQLTPGNPAVLLSFRMHDEADFSGLFTGLS